MVKITNPLGDIKTGKQGEVVYQRKYGEQIRRLVSPKRAMASEAQQQHRQLYRSALNWRKSLTLAHKRFLQGYCMANSIIDSYGLPLPWSWFALRLYLQKVKFSMVDFWSDITAGTTTRYEYFTGYSDRSYMVWGKWWESQTFTPQQAHTVTFVKLKIYRTGYPGTLTVSIRNTDQVGSPIGSDLCVGEFDANQITTDTEGEFYQINLGAGTPLLADTEYAIVIRALEATGDTNVYWRCNDTNDYPRGNRANSSNYGESWTPQPSFDFLFEEWEKTPDIEIKHATLHVKHPSLLTITHKRGELTINGYDTLSSLDDEYLTAQVGCDVEDGDHIEATTLPGIMYPYQVAL